MYVYSEFQFIQKLKLKENRQHQHCYKNRSVVFFKYLAR